MEFQQIKEHVYNKYLNKYGHLIGKVGIYKIVINDEIVYIGKSTNVYNRIVAHIINATWAGGRDYNSKKYQQLRLAQQLHADIKFELVEETTKENIDEREDYYIELYYPKLNTMIPIGGGKHKKKPVTEIFDEAFFETYAF